MSLPATAKAADEMMGGDYQSQGARGQVTAKVVRRSLISLAVFLLLLAAILFLPAGIG